MELPKDESDFLTHFQHNIFKSKMENGSPSDKADIVRNILVQLQFASVTGRVGRSGIRHLSREYEDTYAGIVDSFDEQTGLNNYAEGALALCQGHANESQQWKSSLTSDKLKSLPCVQKILTASKKEAERLLPERKRNDLLPSCTSGVPPPEDVSFSSRGSVLAQRNGADLPDWSRKSSLKHVGSSVSISGQMGPTSSTSAVPNELRPERKPLFSAGGSKPAPFGQYGGRQSGMSANYRQDQGEGIGIKRPYRDVEDENNEETTNTSVPSAFRTAKQQLTIDNQRKYGGQPQSRGSVNTSAYGTVKKSLGPRRGPSSKFVPPVMNREEDDSMSNHAASTITRAVLKTGGTGGSSAGVGGNIEGLDDERLKGIEPKMVELIMNEIMDSGPKITWDDIAGLEFAKKTIKEIVVWPMLRPDIFTGLRGPPKGLLLFGPPGTGKTLIGKCIACQSSSTFFCISASSLTSKWVGEGEKMVRALFAVARCNQPAVVFIDEIDSLLTQRTDGENEASRRIKTEFLVQLDGAATSSDDRILIVGATNRPQEIDEAARRRFVKRLYIPLPEFAARQQIIVNLLKQQSYHLTAKELDSICQKTDGFSGADMATLCREAALGPIRDMSFGDIENISADQVRPITFCDFEDAMCNVKPSVSTRDLEAYLDWNKTFGSGSR